MSVYCCERFEKTFVETQEGDVVVMGNPVDGFVKFDLAGLNFKRWLHKALPHVDKVKNCPYCGRNLRDLFKTLENGGAK